MTGYILVADDNAVNLLVAQKILQNAGYLVELACNGTEAVQACVIKDYDLVLMDCHMPMMDGFEATKRIRQLQKKQPIIIAVTALSAEDARNQCMQDLMNGYLRKPYTPAQLCQLVHEKLTAIEERSDAI